MSKFDTPKPPASYDPERERDTRLIDALDDLSMARDFIELILMAHRYTPAGDSEAKAVSTVAWQAVERLDAAVERLGSIRDERASA